MFVIFLDDKSELLKLAEGHEANATPTPVVMAYKYANKQGKWFPWFNNVVLYRILYPQ